MQPFPSTPVRPGAPLRASDWNRTLECARASAPMPHVGGTLETTVSGAASRVRSDQFPSPRRHADDSPFPWGSRWLWGFELRYASGSPVFVLHRSAMRVGSNYIDAIVTDGLAAFASIAVPGGSEWGVAVDLDWGDSTHANYGAALVLVTAAGQIDVHPEPATETTAPERIPVAWFDERCELVRDYVHGLAYPQVWVP